MIGEFFVCFGFCTGIDFLWNWCILVKGNPSRFAIVDRNKNVRKRKDINMSTALVGESSTEKKPKAKKSAAPKAPKGVLAMKVAIESAVETAVDSVIPLKPEVIGDSTGLMVQEQAVVKDALNTAVNTVNGESAQTEAKNSGGYSGPLPTFNGQPVFIDRESGGWAFYMNPQAFGADRPGRPRNYLMAEDAFDIAEALGRPLTIEDIKFLVGPDEDQFVCSATKKPFQPFWWVIVTKDLLAQLREGKTLKELDSEEGNLTIVGHFFFRNGQVLAYGGTPYRFKAGEDDSVAWHSPVTIAYKANGHRWPIVRGHAEYLKASRQEKREELNHMSDEIARQIGSDWRPSDNNGHKGNRRRENRHGNRR